MGCVKTLIILSIAAFYLPVVTGCKGPFELVPYPVCVQVLLERSRLVPVSRKAVGKFRTVIRLDALDEERGRFYKVIHKLCERIVVYSSKASTKRRFQR